MIEISVVESKQDWEQFIDLPWRIYPGNSETPQWVPPLRLAVRESLDVGKNPFFRHASMLPLIAKRKGEIVGRAVGVIDDSHNNFHKENIVFFGYFECVNDPEIAQLLLSHIAEWGKENGMTHLRGPVNLSTNHECGLLVEGYQEPPYIMMLYNPPYYEKLLEGFGLKQAMDLYAYDIDSKRKFSDRILAHAERLRASVSITFRELNVKEFEKEVDHILEVYNDAWESNWGFVPMNPYEFKHMAREMKLILDPRMLLLIEVNGEIAGFALTLPDIHQAQRHLKDGKLLPFGIFKLLWFLKGPFRKRTVNRCRILTLGFKKKFREMGLGPLFYAEFLERGKKYGYPNGEASWILANNRPMNKAAELMGGVRTKTYRIFEKAI